MRALALLAALAVAATALCVEAAKTTTTVCDDACQKHVKLVEGAILALTVGSALAAGAGFLHAIDTPTRFLGGVGSEKGGGGGVGGDGAN